MQRPWPLLALGCLALVGCSSGPATVDPCAAKPCHNSGTCTASGSAAVCACPAGVTGATCEVVPTASSLGAPAAVTAGTTARFTAVFDDPGQVIGRVAWSFGDGASTSDTAPSRSGRTVTSVQDHTYGTLGGFTVTAQVAFDGGPTVTRSTTVSVAAADPCTSGLCQNGGVCTNTAGSASCACAAGFTGATCSKRLPTLASITVPATATVQAQVGFTASITDPDLLATSVAWSFGDGATSTDSGLSRAGTLASSAASHTFASAGSFTVTATLSPGGGAVVTRSATVVVSPPDPCASLPCQNGGSCSSTGGVAVCSCAAGFTGATCAVRLPQVTAVSGSSSAALGASVAFTATVNDPDQLASSIAWSFGDTASTTDSAPQRSGAALTSSVSHTFTSVGPFTVTAAVAAGQSAPSSKTLAVNIADPCAGLCQNGGVCTNTAGSASCACAAGFTGATCSKRLPTLASISVPATATVQAQVGFTASITDPDLLATSVAWSFGDGATSTDSGLSRAGTLASSAASHSFASAGTFTVTATLSPGGGAVVTRSASVVVSPPDPCTNGPCQNGGVCSSSGGVAACSCAAGFTGPTCALRLPQVTAVGGSSNAALGASVTFTATVNDPDQLASTVAWSFGDGASTTDSAPQRSGAALTSSVSHTFVSAGPFTVTATVAAGQSAPSSKGLAVTVTDPCAGLCQNGGVCTNTAGSASCACAAGFTGATCSKQLPVVQQVTGPGSAKVNGASSFTATVADPDQLATSVAWTFGDGTSKSDTAPLRQGATVTSLVPHAYAAAGTFTAQATVTVGQSPPSSQTTSVTVTDPCAPSPCLNGGTCSNATASAVCTCASGFTGATCALQQPQVVQVTPGAPLTAGVAASFTASVSDPDGLATTLLWSFGDSVTLGDTLTHAGGAATSTVSHTYAAQGTFTLGAQVTVNGQTSSLTQQVQVAPGAPPTCSVTAWDVSTPGFKFTFSGEAADNPTITVCRGQRFTFHLQDLPSFHPFCIWNAGDNNNAPGVTNNCATGTTDVVWDVPADLTTGGQYKCSIHFFGGTFAVQ